MSLPEPLVQLQRELVFEIGSALAEAFSLRLVVVSPPRTGSTPLARLLWENAGVSHHCHEPFEACYWDSRDVSQVMKCLGHPMNISTGKRNSLIEIGSSTGLLVKEMTFQMKPPDFEMLVGIATHPIIFVMRDPRISTVSRLKIVRELSGSQTFAPEHSGWTALQDQVDVCRENSIPYVIIDSDDLRRSPRKIYLELMERLGLPTQTMKETWAQRSGLQLCAPEVGALMGDVRATSDPFYRRVLSSTNLQPPDIIDYQEHEEMIRDAGLETHVIEWRNIYANLREDSNLLA